MHLTSNCFNFIIVSDSGVDISAARSRFASYKSQKPKTIIKAKLLSSGFQCLRYPSKPNRKSLDPSEKVTNNGPMACLEWYSIFFIERAMTAGENRPMTHRKPVIPK
jgi:hypothetical protein